MAMVFAHGAAKGLSGIKHSNAGTQKKDAFPNFQTKDTNKILPTKSQ